MKEVILVLTATVIFVYFDVVVSTIALGLYKPSFQFSINLLEHYLFFKDGYSFLTSPVDFVILSLFRTGILIIGVYYFLKKVTPKWNLFFVGIELTNISFTFLKILAFAEHPEQLGYFGFWLSLVWNEITFLALIPLWYGIYRSPKLHRQTQELWTPSEDYTALTTVDGDLTDSSNTRISVVKMIEERISTFEHVIKLLDYCKHYAPWFAGGFFFLTIYSLARVFQPKYTAQVITNIVNIKQMSDLVNSVGILASLCVVSSISSGFKNGLFDYATALVNRKMRSDLFRSLVQQEIGFFDERKTGEIMSRLTSDCQTMSATVSSNVNVFLRSGVMFIGSLIFMLTISWRLTLVSFIAVPFIGFITKAYGAYYDKLSEKTQSAIAQANQIAEQALGSIRTVRSFACELKESDRFEAELNRTLKINGKKSIAYSGYTWLNELTDNAILVAILFYGGHLVLTDKMEVDGLFSFLLYQLQLGETLYNFGWVFTSLMESVGASRKVFEYLYRQPKITYNGMLKPTAIEGKVAFNDIVFSYPTRASTLVLNRVSFTVNPGETVALVGPSGAGKSSIISLLEHFYEPRNGKITLDNYGIEEYDHKYFHQKVAMVSQEPVLHDGTVRYNILYGCEEWATESEMIRAAKLANIHEFIMESEKGYDTQCGEKGVQMSGGQKQRIAIARALVREPAVLILDEATSALDAESEHIIQTALAQCAIGRSVIIIAHRLSTVEKADRIVVINKGKVIQTGNHKTLMQNSSGLYYSLVQRQLLQQADESDA
uniref:ATP-binding cassette sub-family B member 9 n=1 Tax=Panagrolaimus superbus TaxID=310955 RepID=A0A914Z044_9BILA